MFSSAKYFFFFFQAEDGIRDYKVTGVQTCALPICRVEVDVEVRPVQRDLELGDLGDDDVAGGRRGLDRVDAALVAHAVHQAVLDPVVDPDQLLVADQASDGLDPVELARLVGGERGHQGAVAGDPERPQAGSGGGGGGGGGPAAPQEGRP